MEFFDIFLKKRFWIVLVGMFVYFTLIEWRYWLYRSFFQFVVDILLSLVVSFVLTTIFFALIFVINYFLIHLVDLNKFINLLNYQ